MSAGAGARSPTSAATAARRASLKLRAKLLLRSGSLALVRAALGPYDPVPRTLAWRGLELHFRPGSSDPWLLYEHLMKPAYRNEYAPPPQAALRPDEVRSVLDIGANIGSSALYFARLFPHATVYAFEPVPDNFTLLARNAANCRRIRTFPFGLGSQDASVELMASDHAVNFGGYSRYPAGSDPARRVRVAFRAVGAVLRELALERVDVIKIDTEGAEYDILTAVPESVLRSARLITGELHGERDFALLEYLSQWFDVGARKHLRSRRFNFQAVPKQSPSAPGKACR